MKTRAEGSKRNREPMWAGPGKSFHISMEDAVFKLHDRAKFRLEYQGLQDAFNPRSHSKIANFPSFDSARQECHQLVRGIFGDSIFMQQEKIDVVGAQFAKT